MLYCTRFRMERPGSEVWPEISCVAFAQDTTLTVPLFTQMYKWVPAISMPGGNPAMDEYPIQGE